MPPPLYFCPIFSTPLSFGHSPYILLCKNTPPCCGTRQGEDCATKDFLSLPKKVLVTLICVICSFFSTARRTNQEAPPLLSGFWVRRYGRRRGLRNSLRSDSPRPFSSVFLATSPPDKGGDFARAFAGLFNPLALWALPLDRCAAQGERDMHHSVLVIEGISPSPLPCPVALREVVLAIGETHRTLFCGEGLADCLFVIYLSFSSRRSERIWIFFSLSYVSSSCIRSVRLAWSKGSFKAVSTARAIA